MKSKSYVPNVLLYIVAVLVLLLIGCDNDGVRSGSTVNDGEKPPVVDPPGKEYSLVGTTWRLIGIVDAETGVLQELYPKDCNGCYTLRFDPDVVACPEFPECNLITYSACNTGYAIYDADYVMHRIHMTPIATTIVGCAGDEELWWKFIYTVEYFSLQENELKLYYNDGKNYLFFKPFVHDQISLNLSKSGEFDPMLLVGVWDLVKYAYTADGNTISDIATIPKGILTIPIVDTTLEDNVEYEWEIEFENTIRCNSLLSGNLIKIVAVPITYMAVSPYEDEILAALNGAYSFVVKGDELIIYYIGAEDKNLIILKKRAS